MASPLTESTTTLAHSGDVLDEAVALSDAEVKFLMDEGHHHDDRNENRPRSAKYSHK
eukprot:CAMPEP_0195150584 /NCGR_PEP_ID=MMETSP0448-20130528/179051_1 /TAXON_ID=66468 /ORGANISM="Heterocapsa triquestra, Strain CCMP 448" /LENGTH=56 /DNA_ID=CAMNT_0040189267 /DNA_START=52 /DNA_END=222 /DNA_ORIENTATION=+